MGITPTTAHRPTLTGLITKKITIMTQSQIFNSANLEFIGLAKEKHLTELKENEFFAVAVIDDEFPRNKNPHVKGFVENLPCVGIECSSDKKPYISKLYHKRDGKSRGLCVIVKPTKDDIKNNYYIL